MQPQTQQQSGIIPPKKVAYIDVRLVSAVSSGMVPDKALTERLLQCTIWVCLPTPPMIHATHHITGQCAAAIWYGSGPMVCCHRCLGHGVGNMPCGSVCGTVRHCVASGGTVWHSVVSTGWCWVVLGGIGQRWTVLYGVGWH